MRLLSYFFIGGYLLLGTRYRPTNTSFSPDGGYFLGDGYGSNYLHQFDKYDKYARTIGGGDNRFGRVSYAPWAMFRHS
jgi:hypothetical protein